MKKYITLLPLFLLFVVASCSESTPAEEEDKKEEPKKALIEREPEIREYLEVTKEIVDEYITVAEVFIEGAEKMDSGDLDALETISLISKMGDAALKIQELNAELELAEERKQKIEEKLTADDVQEFVMLYGDTMKRAMELASKIEEIGGLDIMALATGSDSSSDSK